MKITLPEFSLIILVGATGSGKSTFAQTHFKQTEVISAAYGHALASDDENDETVTDEATDLLHFIVAKRLEKMRLTVIDAANVQPEARRPLLQLAKKYYCSSVAIVFNQPGKADPKGEIDVQVARQQRQQVRQFLKRMKQEGFQAIYVLDTPAMIETTTITREPLVTDKRTEHGPFDIIGDVHGCFDELTALLRKLGYQILESADYRWRYRVIPPAGRKAVFVGDLVDRGPKSPDVLRLVMGMVEAGQAICVPGNHDDKLIRYLQGRKVRMAPGLVRTLDQLAQEPPEFSTQVLAFLTRLASHYVLDEGRLVVAHAGMKERYQGRDTDRVRRFALFGDTTGEVDEFGYPVRLNWAADYTGKAMVVYGHTPTPEPAWLNNTINIDTGCVFGGKLTALRYPEKEWVSVPSVRMYAESAKFKPNG